METIFQTQFSPGGSLAVLFLAKIDYIIEPGLFTNHRTHRAKYLNLLKLSDAKPGITHFLYYRIIFCIFLFILQLVNSVSSVVNYPG